jgi:hypothetical protein
MELSALILNEVGCTIMNNNFRWSNANFLFFGPILKQALILARILGHRINMDSIQVC